jgi:hypothetical protein
MATAKASVDGGDMAAAKINLAYRQETSNNHRPGPTTSGPNARPIRLYPIALDPCRQS